MDYYERNMGFGIGIYIQSTHCMFALDFDPKNIYDELN